MRRHNITFGIFFILSIIAFALAAPVLVQEKRDECVDMVRLPKNEITVLGKRGGEEDLQELLDELDRYFMLSPKQAGSSDTHALASSAQAGPSHGSMVDVQAPDKNRRPSLDPNSLSFFSSQPEHPKLQSSNEFGQANEGQVAQMQRPDPRPYNPMLPTQPGSAYGVVTAPPRYLGWQDGHVQQPNSGTWPNPGHYDPWPRLPTKPGYKIATATSTDVWSQKAHVQPEQPNPRPWNTGPSNPTLPTGPRYGVATVPSTGVWIPKPQMWLPIRKPQPEVWLPKPKPLNTGPSNPTLPTGPGYGAMAASSPDPRLPDVLDFERHIYGANYRAEDKVPGPSNPSLPTVPGHGAVAAPSPDLGLPDVADFEGHLYGANYPAKDKTKESRRHFPSTARDGGDAAQREWQSV